MEELSSQAADAFARRAWGETRRVLGSVASDELAPADLRRLAVASYLTGEEDDAVRAWEQAHHRHSEAGERAEAAHCAFWAALCLILRGKAGQAGGWLSRSREAAGDLDCPAAGYVLIPAVLGALGAGHVDEARRLSRQAGEVAARFEDPDLRAFSVLTDGEALLARGEDAAGLARLDEVMLAVTSDEVGPITSGIVYCAVLLECLQAFDLARASEWTAALEAWCATQPDLVPYRGQCLVHQSQLHQASGDWHAAVSEAATACDRLRDPPHPALGLACYQEGELHRVQGELDEALDAYERAAWAGYQPMPGMALLERARGQVEAATASIRRALLEAVPTFQRPPLLAAAVEVFLADDDLSAAGTAAAELAQVADGTSSEVLGAIAEQATGSVQLARGDASAALGHLRAAAAVWQRLRLPYESARAAVLLGRACLALGDRRAAGLELDRAREAFASLGAATDLDDLADRVGAGPAHSGGLSVRELEVLAQVARGRTNREAAEALSISRHTVARHLENISAKLGVRGRAAVTAYAYRHDLL